jgi:hypothetical protein
MTHFDTVRKDTRFARSSATTVRNTSPSPALTGPYSQPSPIPHRLHCPRRLSDEAGNLYTGLRGSDHAERMFINEPDFVRILNYYTETVETADIAFEGVARDKEHLDFYSSFAHLIEKLILNIKMRFRHFRTPVY